MINRLVATAALLLAAPLSAQNAQERLDARYDRALAAGYKALFLCSAIANAERNGATRTPESVEKWELTGIQSPLDEIVGELTADIIRDDEGLIDGVTVAWNDHMPPRLAMHHVGHGCRNAPIGATLERMDGALADPAGLTVVLPSHIGRFHTDAWPSFAPVVAAFTDNAFRKDARTTAAMVVKDRTVVAERYAEDFGPDVPQRTWSVAKSIAATLVGAAIMHEDIDPDGSAGRGVNESDPRRAISIDALLRMASGRYSDTPGNRTDPLYFGGATVEETATHWPLIDEPGETFRYANNDTLMAIRAIKHTFEEHPPARFFAKVGMDHTVAETDWQGDYILSSQVWATAGDLAKLGQLYLDDGVLPSGERILPEGWVEYVSAPSGPQPDRGCIGYGASWWLFNSCEGIPPDTIAAMGNRGQYVVVVPSRDVVIVRRGEDPAGGDGFDIISFTRDVLAALEN
ncbi:serine hydrolase domain-containing protein [Altererythrobacter sp. MF3-039]|uniref:serine hydrolase domain-containing protein n=1 Tax=Altererythrobacter sp. MF3-039 TaxID=3252901 RepID=UPI00390C795C